MNVLGTSRSYLNIKSLFWKEKPITIIKYHSISDEYDSYTISPINFRLQLESISKNYKIIRLRHLKTALSRSDINQRIAIITFDDAFSDFYDSAYPIIQNLSIPCTVFIPSGLIGKYNEWDSNMINYVRRMLMTSRQLNELRKQGLVDFGSHSINHKSMSKLPINEMIKEAVESKRTLEEILDYPITMFSYPFGHHSNITTKILSEAGYEIAITSRWGTQNSAKQILRLKRVSFEQGDKFDDIRDKIEGLYDIYHIKGIGSKLRKIMPQKND